MGRGVVVAGLFRAERYGVEERTTDPASYQEGEAWLRTDLAPDTDQIATLRFYNGSVIYDVPVLSLGSSFSSVSEALRIRVAGTTGYIPIIAPSDAAFEDIRFQHSGGTTALHDEPGLAAFFDVSIASTNSPVTEGENLNVDYSVTNTGDVSDTQDIVLRDFGDTQVDQDTGVSLSGSQSVSGTLTWSTQAGDSGSGNIDVVSENDIASSSVTIEGAILDSGLIHRYKFNDDSTGSTAVDSEGSNDGTINGGAYTTTAKEGSHALSIDGAADYVDLGTGIYDTSSSFSVCFWVQFNTLSSDQRMFTTRSDVNTLLSQGRAASDSVEMWSDGNDWQLGSVTTGTWYHIGYTYDESSTTLTGFLDGSQKQQVTHDPTAAYGSVTAFGCDTHLESNHLDGILDDALLYNRELSASEMGDIYNSY